MLRDSSPLGGNGLQHRGNARRLSLGSVRNEQVCATYARRRPPQEGCRGRRGVGGPPRDRWSCRRRAPEAPLRSETTDLRQDGNGQAGEYPAGFGDPALQTATSASISVHLRPFGGALLLRLRPTRRWPPYTTADDVAGAKLLPNGNGERPSCGGQAPGGHKLVLLGCRRDACAPRMAGVGTPALPYSALGYVGQAPCAICGICGLPVPCAQLSSSRQACPAPHLHLTRTLFCGIAGRECSHSSQQREGDDRWRQGGKGPRSERGRSGGAGLTQRSVPPSSLSLCSLTFARCGRRSVGGIRAS